MALADDLAALESAPRNGNAKPCRVMVVLDKLDAKTAAVFSRLVDQTDVPAPMIAGKLTDAGFELNAAQIGHHRRRLRGAGCRCPRPDEEK